jgi:hypothetical protein
LLSLIIQKYCGLKRDIVSTVPLLSRIRTQALLVLIAEAMMKDEAPGESEESIIYDGDEYAIPRNG